MPFGVRNAAVLITERCCISSSRGKIETFKDRDCVYASSLIRKFETPCKIGLQIDICCLCMKKICQQVISFTYARYRDSEFLERRKSVDDIFKQRQNYRI